MRWSWAARGGARSAMTWPLRCWRPNTSATSMWCVYFLEIVLGVLMPCTRAATQPDGPMLHADAGSCEPCEVTAARLRSQSALEARSMKLLLPSAADTGKVQGRP